jgi:hypothetical protein
MGSLFILEIMCVLKGVSSVFLGVGYLGLVL